MESFGLCIWLKNFFLNVVLEKICKLNRKIMKNKIFMTFRTGKLRIVEESRGNLRFVEETWEKLSKIEKSWGKLKKDEESCGKRKGKGTWGNMMKVEKSWGKLR